MTPIEKLGLAMMLFGIFLRLGNPESIDRFAICWGSAFALGVIFFLLSDKE